MVLFCVAIQKNMRSGSHRECMNELRGIVGNPEAGRPLEAGEPAPTLSLWTTMEHQYSAAPHWNHTPSSLSSGINLSFHQQFDLSMADQKNWCSNHGCSYFPVTVFISWFWQVSIQAISQTPSFRRFSWFFSLGRSPWDRSFT